MMTHELAGQIGPTGSELTVELHLSSGSVVTIMAGKGIYKGYFLKPRIKQTCGC